MAVQDLAPICSISGLRESIYDVTQIQVSYILLMRTNPFVSIVFEASREVPVHFLGIAPCIAADGPPEWYGRQTNLPRPLRRDLVLYLVLRNRIPWDAREHYNS